MTQTNFSEFTDIDELEYDGKSVEDDEQGDRLQPENVQSLEDLRKIAERRQRETEEQRQREVEQLRGKVPGLEPHQEEAEGEGWIWEHMPG